MTSTAVAPRNDSLNTLRGMLEKNKQQFALALPKHITADRITRQVLTQCSRNPKLLECSPLSVCGASMIAAELGLELSGPLGQAFLIPRWNSKARCMEANFQLGYKGIKDLAFRSGQLRSFPARVRYEMDEFDISYGTNQYLHHKPYDGPDPGKVVGVYAVINLAGGDSDFEYWSYGKVEEHRKRFSKFSDKEDSPWQTDWEAMAKKTLMIAVGKRCPMSVEFQTAIGHDEVGIMGVGQEYPPGITNTMAATELQLDQLKSRVHGVTSNDDDEHSQSEELRKPCTKEQLERIETRFKKFKWGEPHIRGFLEQFHVTAAKDLTLQDAEHAMMELAAIDQQAAQTPREPGQDE